MDFVKSQLARIQQQLQGLSASQKMLSGTLVAIMVMTLFYWSRYASEPEMVPVTVQALSTDQIAPITTQLSAKGVKYRVEGDRVLIPSDRRYEVFADLYYQQLVPSDLRNGFDELFKSASPWESPAQQQARVNRAREITAANIISRFPQVASAQVIIDPNAERRIGLSVQPSAAVYISMRPGHKPDKRLVNAAADLISGSVASLPRERVAVVIDGVTYPVRPEDEPIGDPDNIIQLIQQHERRYVEKIQDALRFIPSGVLVSVTVRLDTVTRHTVRQEVDVERSLHKPIRETINNEESRTANRGGGEPGMMPNAGLSNQALSLEAAGFEDMSTTRERIETEFVVEPSRATITEKMPAGSATVVAAAVRIPRSYFVNVYRSRNPQATRDPDDDVLRPLISDELPKIRDQVMACTDLRDMDAVKVETYVDLTAPVDPIPAPATSGMPATLGTHAREIAVGVLAVMSLLMLLMMVRKSTPTPVVTVRPEPVEPPALRAAEDLAGEAVEGNPLLDGMELDEDAIKTQQMLQQVQTLVNDNPDAAANLVKRWLSRS